MPTITVRLTDEEMNALDVLVRDRKLESRSDAIRDLVKPSVLHEDPVLQNLPKSDQKCSRCNTQHVIKATGNVDRMCPSSRWSFAYSPVSKEYVDWYTGKVEKGINVAPAFQRYGG